MKKNYEQQDKKNFYFILAGVIVTLALQVAVFIYQANV
jgi:hypothetical protein